MDNPDKVPESKCRAYAGWVIHGEVRGPKNDFLSCINILQLDAKDKDSVASAGLKLRYFPPTTCVSTVFPYRTKLSILVAVLKVYPALKKQKIVPFVAV